MQPRPFAGPANRQTHQERSSKTTLGGRSMSELQGIARFRFHPGKVEEFKRLSAEAM
jgi:hypothetical protein